MTRFLLDNSWNLNFCCVRALHDATGPVYVKKGQYSSSRGELHLRATGRHLPYGITQCYLPPDTSECTPPNPRQAGTRFTYPGGMEG